MLSYIASNSTADLIKTICTEQDITILNQEVDKIDFLKYIKETKVNFNLIKYLIIDLEQIENTEDEVISSIKYFGEMYVNTKLIIIARGYESQNYILTSLYDIGLYNIINNSEIEEIKTEIRKCLLQGIQEKEARKFKRIEEVKEDKKQIKSRYNLKEKQSTEIKVIEPNKIGETQGQTNAGVYFFALLIEALTRLIKLIGYVAVFILTSIGITILLNAELRDMVFQILGLE